MKPLKCIATLPPRRCRPRACCHDRGFDVRAESPRWRSPRRLARLPVPGEELPVDFETLVPQLLVDLPQP